MDRHTKLRLKVTALVSSLIASFALCLIPAPHADAARFIPGVVATPLVDLIDVIVRRREVIAVDPVRGGTKRAALLVGEDVLWSGARGKVAIVVTDRRILGTTTSHGGWHAIRLKVHESDPRSIMLGDRVALIVTDMRAIGLSAGGKTFTTNLIGTTEKPFDVVVGDNVAAMITDRRLLALSGFFPGFAETLIGVHEDVEFTSTLPNFISVGTHQRVLVFRGTTGAWAAERVSLR